MLQTLFRRLLIIPPVLFLIHFIGYAYAYFALPIRAARLPFFPRNIQQPPLLQLYGDYVSNALRFDFGTFPGGLSIPTAMVEYAGRSLGLLSVAMLLAVVAGLALGLFAVSTHPPRVATWLNSLSTLGLAMPSFYIGSLLIMGAVFYLINTPPNVEIPFAMRGFGWTPEYMTLPIIALTLRPTVQIAKVTATLLVDELGKQYIVTARSVGNTLLRVRWRHALSNILAQVVLTFFASLRLTVGELIVVEWLFQWPGLGRLLAQTLVPPQISSDPTAPLFLDPVVIAGVLTTIALIFLLTDLVASMTTRAIDPRLRMEQQHG